MTDAAVNILANMTQEADPPLTATEDAGAVAWILTSTALVFLMTAGLGFFYGLVFASFQMTFAIIASAIISGSLVERVRFSAYCIMLALWSLLIYAPLCHWVWGPGGWIGQLGALDFAGGTVVHISSGVSGLVAGAILGP
ncbi:amt, partial [Symbiodinium sp. CCMP2456]